MFTPTLLTALIHSAWSEKAENTRGDLKELATLLDAWVLERGWKDDDSPRIPIVGQFNPNLRIYTETLREGVDYEELFLDGQYYVWGRARLGRVVSLLNFMNRLEQEAVSPGVLDLGTPLEPVSGPSTLAAQNVLSAFKQHLPKSPEVAVIIIDSAIPSTSFGPADFNGRLHHLVQQGVEMSDHAVYVLDLIVDGLKLGGGLQRCALVCGLVSAPAGVVNGLPSFARTNAVDLLSVLKRASTFIPQAYPNLPIVMNISLGTHGGPHNGISPLESTVSAICKSLGECYIHCAAGNDGSKAVHTTIELSTDRPKLIRFALRKPCKEFLLEFWYADSGNPLTINVRKNKPLQFAFSVNGGSAFQLCTPDPTGASRHRWKASVVQNAAYTGMRSVAFGLSSPNTGILDGENFEIELESSADATVHGWTAVCDDPEAILYGGAGIAGNIRVPATALDVVCVTGVDEYGRWWTHSSEGPLPSYRTTSVGMAPHVAHQVTCSYAPDESGTSFAAPRVAAATAQWLLNRTSQPARRLDQQALVTQLIKNPFSRWDSALGWGKF